MKKQLTNKLPARTSCNTKRIFYFVFIFLFYCSKSIGQNLVQNGNFQNSGLTNWVSTAQYWNLATTANSGCVNSLTQYAYHGNADGSWAYNSFGSIYQEVTIPSNTTSATIQLKISINTEETTTSVVKDVLDIQFRGTSMQLLTTFASFSNLDGVGATACKAYQTFTYNVPSQYFGQTVRLNFQGVNDNVLRTIFRIDDVSLTVVTGPTSCVSWENGINPTNQLVITAAEYLCQRNIINGFQSVQDLLSLNLGETSETTINALYNGNVPSVLPTDNYPLLVSGIQALPFYQYQATKALCFLENTDGRSCVNRDFYVLEPFATMSQGRILRILLEAWNFVPDTTGGDIYSHSPSSFLCNVFKDDANYGYFKKAHQLGLISDYISANCFSDASPGEFFYVILYKLHSQYGSPTITADSYYKPNNFDPQNLPGQAGIERAVFSSYEQNGFSLPSGGIGLDFNYSYHSNLLEYPTIGEDWQLRQYGSLENHKAIIKNYPIGKGWTHSYNIYANTLRWPNSNGIVKESALLFHWGDGSLYMYNLATNKFETNGVYDDLVIDGYDGNGLLQQFHITTKNKITYRFYRSNYQFYCTYIIDRNGNETRLIYENAECNNPPASCVGSTTSRLFYVFDQAANRRIDFVYQTNSDLLKEVKDNAGRSIKFFTNIRNYNLDSSVNARGLSTKYKYCNADSCSNMLIEIQRPKGNWIKNNYVKRRLQKSQTPNYSASINFASNYNSGNQTTQSVVTMTPTSGATYSVSYQHNSLGQPTSATIAGSTTQIQYNDALNPTLPTTVTDNATGITTSYTYDGKGNQTMSTVANGSLSQTTKNVFNVNNDVIETQLPNGSKLFYSYDAKGNLITEKGPNGHVNQYSRNSNGTTNTKTNANGIVTRFGYNNFGNPNLITVDGTTIKTEAVYDNVSRIIHTKDPLGVVSKFVYDNNDNILQTIIDTSQLKLVTSYKFDANDNQDLIIAPKGDSTKLIYDPLNDDLVEEQYGGFSRAWGYFDDGTLSFMRDKKGTTHWSDYYPSGSPLEGKLRVQLLSELFYDNSTKLLNRRKRLTGSIIYNYDPLLRITGIQFKDSVGSNQLFASEVKYEYNVSDFQTKIEIPGVNKHFRYVPDSSNRVLEVYDWNNTQLVKYQYRPDGLLNSEVLGNGVTIFYHYDAAGRQDSIYAKSTNGTLLYSIGATLDDKGNHVAESYYVNKGSLPVIIAPTEESTINQQFDFSTNRLSNTNGQSASSDANGNILQNNYTGFGSVANSTAYDFFDNITKCTVDNASHTFKYDPLDNRYTVDTNTYITDFLNNGNVLVQSRIGVGPQKLYCHSQHGLICSIDNNTNQRRWYLYDFRGSTVALLDDNQNVVEYYKYEPFGTITESSNAPGKTTPFLYVGRYGVEYQSPHLYYMRARYYDPTNGRFYGEDPVWSSNLFVYGDNNPLSNVDPNGTFPITLSLGSWLYKNKNGLKAINDFGKNYYDMRDAGFIGGDLYFHCKANYTATARGNYGEFVSVKLSNAREVFQQRVMNESAEDARRDQQANIRGRIGAKNKLTLQQACSPYRPRALPIKY